MVSGDVFIALNLALFTIIPGMPWTVTYGMAFGTTSGMTDARNLASPDLESHSQCHPQINLERWSRYYFDEDYL